MSDERTLKRLGTILRDACNSLTSALNSFWPANKEYDVPEQNLVAHLAIAFARAGFHPYAEVPIRDDGAKRVDLLAIDLDSRIAVAVEAKRFRMAQGDSANALLADWERLKAVRVPMKYNDPKSLRKLTCCRMIAATNWTSRWSSITPKWCKNPDKARTGGDKRWPGLRKELSKSHRWVSPMDVRPDWQEDAHKMHVLAAAQVLKPSAGWFGE